MNHLAFSLNEIVAKFRSRNTAFSGEISLITTSFEALFLFDLLRVQDTSPQFWKLNFLASNFYTFGMPSKLLMVRTEQGHIEMKNCRKFTNVVHRLDPISQRIEPLIKPEFSRLPPESIENDTDERMDFTIADGSSLESFSLKNYFSSELIILKLTRDIYGKLKMDSGSL
jgi:DDHD domain